MVPANVLFCKGGGNGSQESLLRGVTGRGRQVIRHVAALLFPEGERYGLPHPLLLESHRHGFITDHPLVKRTSNNNNNDNHSTSSSGILHFGRVPVRIRSCKLGPLEPPGTVGGGFVKEGKAGVCHGYMLEVQT
jgi:hypothetical protein